MENQNRLPVEISADRFHVLGVFPANKDKRVCDFFDRTDKKSVKKCLIWKNRPSECASFYCQDGLKKVGQNSEESVFINQSHGLFRLELFLAQYALIELGFSEDLVSESVNEWNSWVDGAPQSMKKTYPPMALHDPCDLYIRSWSQIEKLTWQEIHQIVPRNDRSIFAQMRKIV